jgi:esterase/lipase superfamily enzyme
MSYVDPNLPRELFGWYSPRLGLDMPIVRYGDYGKALLIFPTAQADYLENERFWLIKALEPLIFAGRINVFSIDSINKHAWMNESVHPLEAARRQALYSAYVEEEVVPHIRRRLRDDSARIGVTGASFGAFHAANQFFRRPDLFDTLVAMSGFFDLEPGYMHGYFSEDFYFNNPTSFVPNMHGEMLEILKHHCQIHIVTGQGAYERPDKSQRFSTLLWNKGIWNNLDLWGYDMPHDWPTWRKMLPYYVGERLGW